MADGGGFTGPTTAGRPIIVCIIAIFCLTLIALVGMLTHTLDRAGLIMLLGLIAGISGWGAGAHLAAAERVRSRWLEGAGIGSRRSDVPPATPPER